MGRTGTFICIHSQLERLKTEGVVDFFQAAKSARIQRPGLVPDTVGLFFFPFFLKVISYSPTFTSIGSSLLSTCLTVFNFPFLLYTCPFFNFYLYFIYLFLFLPNKVLFFCLKYLPHDTLSSLSLIILLFVIICSHRLIMHSVMKLQLHTLTALRHMPTSRILYDSTLNLLKN